MVMIALGILVLIGGIAGLIVTQIVLRKMIRNYKQSWEARDEMY